MSETTERAEAPAEEEVKWDLLWLVPYLWSSRRVVYWVVGAFIALGLLRYLTAEKRFVCESLVIPARAAASPGGALSALTQMSGLNLSSLLGSNTSSVSPDLWYTIATSTPVAARLMEVPLTWTSPEDTVETLLSHTQRDTIPTLGSQIKKYTIGLPWTIKGWLQSLGTEAAEEEALESSPAAPDTLVDYTQQSHRLTATQQSCASELASSILIEEDVENRGVYIVRTSGENAAQSAELNVAVLRELKTQLLVYNRFKNRNQLVYLQERLAEATADYQQARHAYYTYKDHHRNIVEERISLEAQNLEDAHTLAYALVQNLQDQLEQQRLLLHDETAPFGVVQPAVEPLKKATPRFIPTMVLSVLLGGFLAMAWLLGRLAWLQVFHPKRLQQLVSKHLFTPTD